MKTVVINKETEIEMLKRRSSEMEVENDSLKEEVEHLRAGKANIETRIFIYNNICADPKLFRKITEFEKEEFVLLLVFLNPGNNNENMKFHEATKNLDCPAVQGNDFILHSNSGKRGPKPVDQLIHSIYITTN